jgi:hypothetical protein
MEFNCAAAVLAAERLTFSFVLETTEVGRAAPFHFATELPTKPLPKIVRLASLPAVRAGGLTEAIRGCGLFMATVMAFDVPPPGLGVNTVTETVAATAKSAAVTFALN